MGPKPGTYFDWRIWDGKRTKMIGDLPVSLRPLELKCVWGCEALAKRIGPEHIGVGWLGHDVGNPDPHYIPGYDKGRTFTGREAQTMRQHWEIFLTMLSERGFTDEQLGMMAGGNYVRIWKEILPDADPSPTVGPGFPKYVPNRSTMHG